MFTNAHSKSFIILFPTLLLAVLLCGVLWYINSINLVSLRVITFPTQTEYVVGESFDDEGMKLEANFSFGITRQVDYFTYNVPEEFIEAGEFDYLVMYNDRGISKVAEFTITVVPRVLTGISIQALPYQTQYVVGQSFDKNGMVVKATFNSRIVETLSLNDPNLVIESEEFDEVTNISPISVSYTCDGVTKSASTSVEVQDKQIVSISTEGAPFKSTYVQTESFNPEGLQVMATYNNGEVSAITNYTTDFDTVKQNIGTELQLAISVVSQAKTLTTYIEIEVVARQVSNISFEAPNKTSYFVGESLDATGMQTVALYNDNTSEMIPLSSCFTDFSFVVSRAGTDKTVVFEYQGFTNEIQINVTNQPMDEDLFYFQQGIITGFKTEALSYKIITLPKSIDGIDVVSARIPKEANLGVDDGSIILDLSYATKLKTLLIEQNVPCDKDYPFPASLTNIFVLSSSYLVSPYFNPAQIRLVSNFFTFVTSTRTISYHKTATPQIPDILIPAYWVDGTPITKIGNFSSISFLSTVGIPEGITNINADAFKESVNISIISLPESIVSISTSAFQSVAKISSIYISKNCTSVQASAFTGTSNLREFVVNSENPSYTVLAGLLVSKDQKTLVRFAERSPYGSHIPDEIEIIGSYAFSQVSSIANFMISANVREIKDNAFMYSSIQKIEFEFGSLLTTIGNTIFNSSQIVDATIPSGVTTINGSLFFMCQFLERAVFETTDLTGIPNSTFRGCTSLTTFDIPEGVTDIGRDAFLDCTALTAVTFPNSLVNIENTAFENCRSLLAVNLKNVQTIGTSIFLGCTSLQTIEIGPLSAFSSINGVLCNAAGTSLLLYPLGRTDTTYTVPGGVTEIAAGAFAYSNYLEEIVTNGVIYIRKNAFTECDKLTNIVMSAALTTIGETAFSNCDLLINVNIGDNVSSISTDFVYGSPIALFTVVSNQNFATDENGVLFKKSAGISTTIFKYPTNRNSSVYSIPATVTFVGNSAFKDCLLLQQVHALGYIYTIGEYAFANSYNITSLFSMSYLDDSAYSIGRGAFMGMRGITSLNLSLAETRTIYDNTFDGCTNMTNLTLPSNVSVLGSNIIRGTKIVSITLPSSVTKVADTFLGATQITIVNCYPTTPPTWEGTSTIFDAGKEAAASTLSINVPTSAFLAYQAKAGWSRYASKIKATNF